MFKKNCSSCAKKIDKKFSYCPYCGFSFKKAKEESDFGMIGRDDFEENFQEPELKMPFGLDKVMNSLVKQLEKQMSGMGDSSGMPKGFRIQISTGKPQVKQVQGKKVTEKIIISEEEFERRKKLPIEDAESKIRRIGEGIVYEISVPGVGSKQDVMITKLENSIEVKAYSKDKCYLKTIPLNVDVIGYAIKDQKLFLELRG